MDTSIIHPSASKTEATKSSRTNEGGQDKKIGQTETTPAHQSVIDPTTFTNPETSESEYQGQGGQSKQQYDEQDALDRAKAIAKQLSEQFNQFDFRFVVKDPTSTGVKNVVIEVLHGDDVVARIPAESAAAAVRDQGDVRGLAMHLSA